MINFNVVLDRSIFDYDVASFPVSSEVIAVFFSAIIYENTILSRRYVNLKLPSLSDLTCFIKSVFFWRKVPLPFIFFSIVASFLINIDLETAVVSQLLSPSPIVGMQFPLVKLTLPYIPC